MVSTPHHHHIHLSLVKEAGGGRDGLGCCLLRSQTHGSKITIRCPMQLPTQAVEDHFKAKKEDGASHDEEV